jgi:hypothetical protein
MKEGPGKSPALSPGAFCRAHVTRRGRASPSLGRPRVPVYPECAPGLAPPGARCSAVYGLMIHFRHSARSNSHPARRLARRPAKLRYVAAMIAVASSTARKTRRSVLVMASRLRWREPPIWRSAGGVRENVVRGTLNSEPVNHRATYDREAAADQGPSAVVAPPGCR